MTGNLPAVGPKLPPESGYSLEIEGDCVVVKHTGALTVLQLEAARRDAADAMVERRLPRARVVSDISGASSGLSPIEIFGLCAGQGSAVPPGFRVAIVYRPGQVPEEDARFAETVSLNRGATLRVFNDVEAACSWLCGGCRGRECRRPHLEGSA